MHFCTLDEDYWSTIIHSIKQQKCILMLGPDASIDDNHPCTEVLAQKLAAKIKTQVDNWNIHLNPSNLVQVASYYGLAKDEMTLQTMVCNFYENRHNQTCTLHENLAELPFYLAVTSTPDKMFYNALKQAGKNPRLDFYHYKGKNPQMIEMGDPQKPLIYQLFGSIDESDSLILTEYQLMKFLVNAASNTCPLPVNISSELKDERKSFLFLGFGFKHWYFRVLLFVLGLGNKNNRSYALEEIHRISEKHISEFHRTIIFFRESDYKIQFIKNDLQSFTSELKQRFEDSINSTCTPTNRVAEIDPDAPVIFICHASEDKEKASDLYDKLTENGLRPWLDKENLRGGDYWDNVIEKTIKKEIDYFIVLQSKALLEKEEGYVNKEINIAFERQQRFRIGTRFIIPVKIEDCTLEQLEFLQSIDLSSGENIDELTKTIKRDFQRRKKNKGANNE